MTSKTYQSDLMMSREAAYMLATVQGLGILASLKFMWDIRKAPEE